MHQAAYLEATGATYNKVRDMLQQYIPRLAGVRIGVRTCVRAGVRIGERMLQQYIPSLAGA